MQTPYACQITHPTLTTGTSACAYPTLNGWAWASKTRAVRWRFSIEVSPTDPRYGSPIAGNLRRDRCFLCGEDTDPRTSAHYESPQTHVQASSVHETCVDEYMRRVWTDDLEKMLLS